MSDSKLTKSQKRVFGPKFYTEAGQRMKIVAHVRYDDECGNGHNTFSITGQTWRFAGKSSRGEEWWNEESGGCIHDEVARHFPELAPLVKWHLCSSSGPLHYPANVLYLAGNRDCWGLLKGEKRQIVNGRTKLPAWKLVECPLPKTVDAAECPPESFTIRYEPWCHVGEGKERELLLARSSAIWPEATDDELCADNLEARLMARLPALLVEFRAAVESLGFVW